MKEVYAALNNISESDLIRKYNSQEMMKLSVYPQIWNEENALDYLIDHFRKLKPFYQDAAKNGEAVVAFIN